METTGSQRPRAVRRRLRATGKAVKDGFDDAEEKMKADIAVLYKPIEEWDWEELSKGRPKGADGRFTGRKPEWITPAVQGEIKRRMQVLTEAELMSHAASAIKVLVELMKDSDVDDFGKPAVPASVRVDAAKYILNHVIGTPKARVELESSNPLRELMGEVLVNPDGEPSHIVIEGSVVEEDDEDDGGE